MTPSRHLSVLFLALAGCPRTNGPTGPVKASEAGLSLTYYVERKPMTPEQTELRRARDLGMVSTEPVTDASTRVVVVEQRRWVDVTADRVLDIDQIDDGADLESLVIESLSNPGGLVLGRCARDSVVGAGRSTPMAWIGRKAEVTVKGGQTASGTITSIDGENVVLAGEDGKTIAVALSRYRAIRVVGGDSMVRCEVESGGGKQLVRVVYTTDALGFSAEHTMRTVLDADGKGTAEITPRFTVVTPAWQITADVALFDGVPGGARAPREVFRGPITLTGDPVVVSGPTRTAAARIDAVYRGAMVSPGESAGPDNQYWRSGSTLDIWDWLELDLGDTMPPGRVLLEITQAGEPVPQPVIVEADAIEVPDDDAPTGQVRIRLWPATELRGQRVKTPINTMSSQLTETLLFSVSNGGDRVREVVIEEELRPAKKKSVLRPWPRKPSLRNKTLRLRIKAPPGRASRAGYVVEYTF